MMTEARLFLLLATFTLSVSANPLPLPACMLALKTHPSCHEFLDNELPLVERECGASANRSLAALQPPRCAGPDRVRRPAGARVGVAAGVD